MRLPKVRPVPRRPRPTDGLFGPADPPEPGPGAGGPVHPRPGFEFPLRDGRLVFLTPVQPEDRERLAAAYELLSDRSRHFRFFRSRDRLSEAELRELTEVDQVDHVAWCALDAPDPPLDGVGSGRMIRSREDPAAAEVAVTVLDAYQGLGLGTVLLGLMVLRARALGIDRLRAFVLPENLVVVRWLLGLGWSVIGEDACLEFEGRVADPAPPTSAPQERFTRLLTELHGPLSRCLDPDGLDPEPGP